MHSDTVAFWRHIPLIPLLLFLLSPALPALEITDVMGKKSVFETVPKNAFGSAVPVTFLLYAFDPKLLVGLNFPLVNKNNTGAASMLSPSVVSLPVLGGWHGNAKGANKETLVSIHPDVILAWKNDFTTDSLDREFAPFGIRVVYVDPDYITKLPRTLTLMGTLFGNPERARELRSETERILKMITRYAASVKKAPRIYYAMEQKGLMTECEDSFHADFIPLIGAENVHKCRQTTIMGMERINKERLIAYNPEIIVTQDKRFYGDVYKDRTLAALDAVKNKRVFLVPRMPFNFLDRPPSFMRLIGSLWLISRIDPEAPFDFKEEMRTFYRTFLHIELSDAQIEEILQ